MTDLPPYSGDNARCAKCQWRNARTRYYAANGAPAHDFHRVTQAEHLERECERCDYRWAEAINPPATDHATTETQ
ncbi:hypothetical protein ACQEU3_46940 [Spirillospora sp. CA-253888]